MAKNKTETLALVLKDFSAAWDYCAGSWHSRWNDNYNLYHGNRVKRAYQGITDTFDPITFSTVEMMTSALFGSRPRFDFIPPAEKQDQNTDILNSLLDYYWDKDQWSIKIINWGREFLMLGTSVVYLYWDGDCPRLINIPIRDFFVDPTASSLESARYMGRRFLTTLDDLKSFEVIDLEASVEGSEAVMKPKYKNLDSVMAGHGASGDETDKEVKDMWYGSTITNPRANQVEVIEYWTEDRVISIANRSVVIEDTENWYKTKARYNGAKFPKGIMPFASLRDYVDSSLFYAKGEVDFILEIQELLNDLTNQNIDSITFTLNQMYTLDPNYSHMIQEIENLPGAVYPVPKDSLVPIDQRPIPPDAFTERLNLKNAIRETTASNEVVKGVPQEGGKVTATEIQAQVAGAGQRMGLKITQIEDEGFHRLAQILFAMVRLYVTEPLLVRVVGKDGIDWQEFDPWDFHHGDYEPRVQLETTVNSEKAEQSERAKEMFAAFLNDPEVNQQELKKLVLQRGFDLDPDEVQLLLTPDPAQMMMQDPLAMGMTDPGMPVEGMAEPLPPEAMV